MSESITIQGNSRKEQYSSLIPQLKALVEGETDQLAALGNIMSALKYGMSFFWVGLYTVKNNELVLGPFQGPIACTRIAFGKGVCGYCWKEQKTVIVEDVNTFSGHIACSSETKSEIVLPVFNKNKEVVMVLDVDSEQLAHFNETDKEYLEEVVHLIEKIITA
ncbi:MAG TPA: GAF domain-containing protein [Bacteroidia bacterium]|jgi:L-methionine (R)-S-oxide reductase|nr:GAF domain-containing protein [Bacteroidia bacterium]